MGAYYGEGRRAVDARMYDQLVAAQNRLSSKLSESNAYAERLQAEVNQCHEDLIAAFELLKQVGWAGVEHHVKVYE